MRRALVAVARFAFALAAVAVLAVGAMIGMGFLLPLQVP